jgi:hypothetical protein
MDKSAVYEVICIDICLSGHLYKDMAAPRLVVLGGFSTGRRTLESIFDCFSEMTPLDQDGRVVFTLDESVYTRYEQMTKAVKDAWVVTHSAGAWALKRSGIVPAVVTAFNPPERRAVPYLLAGSADLLARAAFRTHAMNPISYARVALDHQLEFSRHPARYLRTVPGISGFSATREYRSLRDEYPEVSVDIYHAYGDEIFREPCAVEVAAHYRGGHDRFLLDPRGVCRDVNFVAPDNEFCLPDMPPEK